MMIIANPSAGAGRVEREWASIRGQLRAAFPEAEVELTRGAGEGRRLACEAVRAGAERIVSLGGDGTHNEVVNGIVDADPEPEAIVFGALPAGTGGDFCRMYACERTLGATLDHLRRNELSPFDIGQVDGVDDDGAPFRQAFLNIASCGASGLVDRYVNASSKWMGGTASFFVASLRATWDYTPAQVALRLDGSDVGTFRINTVVACNGRWAGGGMYFSPRASVNDGMLEIVVIEHITPARVVPMARHLYKGTHAALPYVHVMRGRTLRVEPLEASAWLDIDGEAPGLAPCTIRVVPHYLRLLGATR